MNEGLKATATGMNGVAVVLEDCAHPKLTKRELFAAMAMQGLLSNGAFHESEPEQLAEWALHHADALLSELEKPGGAL